MITVQLYFDGLENVLWKCIFVLYKKIERFSGLESKSYHHGIVCEAMYHFVVMTLFIFSLSVTQPSVHIPV